MRISRQWLLVGVIVAGLALGAAAMVYFRPETDQVVIGAQAPDFTVVDLRSGDSVSLRDRYKHWFHDDPVELFKQHVWINPFWEDDIDEVISFMGVDRVLFGSDFPHMEGLERPAQIFDEVNHLPEADQRRIVYGNAAELTGVRSPAPA